ncbi:MAG TPA: alkaline phosphatase family protein [Candidatus Tumulicola sp.]
MISLRLPPAVMMCCFALSACNGATSTMPTGSQDPASIGIAERPGASTSKIQHVIIMIQENRSFNDFFATFPGATGATSGYYLEPEGKTYKKTPITLTEGNLVAPDFNHDSHAYNLACDGEEYQYPPKSCGMDGFNLEGTDGNNPSGTEPYQYASPSSIAPYWSMAKNYGLADHMFQTQGSGSFTAHQDLVHGDTFYPDSNCPTGQGPTCSLIDFPTQDNNWGCSAKQNFPDTKTQLLTTGGNYLTNKGPFPCLTYADKTMTDLLDGAGVSWKYYTPPYKGKTSGALWNAMASISEIYNGPDWKKNVSIPETNIFTDITKGTLPSVSWVIPTEEDSDHPHGTGQIYHGPQWIASVVNAVGKSSYWNSTAIIVTWDDWGGFFDPVPPAFIDDQGGLGFRVPMLVVSPYVKQGTLSHTQYEFASILKFVETNFNLGQMGSASYPNDDKRATSIANMFDFTMSPRKFISIPSSLGRSFFIHKPISYAPVDRE